jgi:uncharacterized protein YdeI (YjbR/CyaY-like superfamily)
MKNYKKTNEIWLIFYKRHTGRPSIPYDDAVEEALCFGWIDSIVKRMDDDRYVRKFTPRSRKSVWSELNIKRAKKMIKTAKMTPPGREPFEFAMKAGKRSSGIETISRKAAIPEDLKKALAKNKKAQVNFSRFAPSHQRNYILWILDAKKKETRERRIKRVVEFAAQNKKSVML